MLVAVVLGVAVTLGVCCAVRCCCCAAGCLLQLCYQGTVWNADVLAVGVGVGSFCCIFGVVPIFRNFLNVSYEDVSNR